MASKDATRLGLLVALAVCLLTGCADVHPVTSSRSGLLTGPGGAADTATGGQGNDARGDNQP